MTDTGKILAIGMSMAALVMPTHAGETLYNGIELPRVVKKVIRRTQASRQALGLL